ncbi:MAG: Arc family DNA-binding protein [Bacteroidota bacterium]
MSERKPFVLRIDQEKLKALEKWAADEFRSTNGQIEYILDQALRKSGRWKIKTDTTNTTET